MTILVTGFEPFAGETVNASWLAVQRLAETWDGDETLTTALLPVEFARCGPALMDAIDGCDPRAIVCVGEAGRADSIRLERVAINLDDARIPDNAGARPIDEQIDPRGPAAYFSTLPLREALGAIEAAGIPVRMSESAGTFACNHVFYELMAALEARTDAVTDAVTDHERTGTDVVGGFVHVPYAPGQRGAVAGVPTLSTEAAAEALRLLVRML